MEASLKIFFIPPETCLPGWMSQPLGRDDHPYLCLHVYYLHTFFNMQWIEKNLLLLGIYTEARVWMPFRKKIGDKYKHSTVSLKQYISTRVQPEKAQSSSIIVLQHVKQK